MPWLTAWDECITIYKCHAVHVMEDTKKMGLDKKSLLTGRSSSVGVL